MGRFNKRTPGNELFAELALMTIGSILIALGVYFFKLPNHFSTGGVSGLSIVLSGLIPNLTSANLILIINVIFLVIGFIVLNRDFGLKTIYCTLLFSVLVPALDWIFPLSAPLTSQPLLELFFAVILPAIGSAMLFHVGASSGGTDIIAMILRKYSSLDIGKALLCTDVFISGATFFVFGPETGLFSILGLVLKSVLVDTVVESLNLRKSFMVISTKPELACDYITNVLHRGATKWQGEGVYSHSPHYVVLTALSRYQAVALRRYLRRNDPDAFILITNSSEIFGKGFLNT